MSLAAGPDMHATLRISFHRTEPSVALEQRIRRKASKLDTLGANVSDCHVVVDGPHRRQQNGNLWAARVELTIPGGAIIASREAGREHANEDVHVAVGDAFDAAFRQLADQRQNRRGRREGTEPWQLGRIVERLNEGLDGMPERSDGSPLTSRENSMPGGDFEDPLRG